MTEVYTEVKTEVYQTEVYTEVRHAGPGTPRYPARQRVYTPVLGPAVLDMALPP